MLSRNLTLIASFVPDRPALERICGDNWPSRHGWRASRGTLRTFVLHCEMAESTGFPAFASFCGGNSDAVAISY